MESDVQRRRRRFRAEAVPTHKHARLLRRSRGPIPGSPSSRGFYGAQPFLRVTDRASGGGRDPLGAIGGVKYPLGRQQPPHPYERRRRAGPPRVLLASRWKGVSFRSIHVFETVAEMQTGVVTEPCRGGGARNESRGGEKRRNRRRRRTRRTRSTHRNGFATTAEAEAEALTQRRAHAAWAPEIFAALRRGGRHRDRRGGSCHKPGAGAGRPREEAAAEEAAAVKPPRPRVARAAAVSGTAASRGPRERSGAALPRRVELGPASRLEQRRAPSGGSSPSSCRRTSRSRCNEAGAGRNGVRERPPRRRATPTSRSALRRRCRRRCDPQQPQQPPRPPRVARRPTHGSGPPSGSLARCPSTGRRARTADDATARRFAGVVTRGNGGTRRAGALRPRPRRRHSAAALRAACTGRRPALGRRQEAWRWRWRRSWQLRRARARTTGAADACERGPPAPLAASSSSRFWPTVSMECVGEQRAEGVQLVDVTCRSGSGCNATTYDTLTPSRARAAD